ncbi:hypothetical protein V8C40DRAFT_228936 [Trichoderma camerunense]
MYQSHITSQQLYCTQALHHSYLYLYSYMRASSRPHIRNSVSMCPKVRRRLAHITARGQARREPGRWASHRPLFLFCWALRASYFSLSSHWCGHTKQCPLLVWILPGDPFMLRGIPHPVAFFSFALL